MSGDSTIRWGWMKGMYLYTLVGAGGFGLGILIMPDMMRSIFGWPDQDPIVLGIAGSVFLSFALLSILGLRAPLKFAPLLLLSLCYKLVWFICVMLPLLFENRFPKYAILHAVIFATYVIGNLIAIPFPYVFAKQSE